MKGFLGFLLILMPGLSCLSASSAFAQAPILFFTDLTSGPQSGGENVSGYAGAYVTIYGNYLGTTQGTSTVTWNGLNCLRVVSWSTPAPGSKAPDLASHSWYQKIVVQTGPSCTAGTGNFVVTTAGGTSNALPYTVRTTGTIRFVVSGSSCSLPNCYTNSGLVSCKNAMSAGDICYVGNGVNVTTQDNYSAAVLLTTGATAANPKAIVGYPGATASVTYNSGYGIAIRQCGACYPASNWVIANMNIQGTPAVELFSSDNVRVIGNHLESPSMAAGGQTASLHVDSETNTYFYGNEVTNVGSTPANQDNQVHATYFTTNSNFWWYGWNHIHNFAACRGLNTNSTGGSNLHDIHVHDNIFHDGSCDGIDFPTASPSIGPIEVYNNLIYRMGLADPGGLDANYAGIYWFGSGTGTMEVYNNTIYDIGSGTSYPNDAGAIGACVSGGTMHLRNNIVYQPTRAYIEPHCGSAYSGQNNLFYGQGNGPAGACSGSSCVNADPKLTSTTLSTFDAHLQAGSPAIGAGATIAGLVTALDGAPRSVPLDIGAYEYNTGSAPPPPPTLISVNPAP